MELAQFLEDNDDGVVYSGPKLNAVTVEGALHAMWQSQRVAGAAHGVSRSLAIRGRARRSCRTWVEWHPRVPAPQVWVPAERGRNRGSPRVITSVTGPRANCANRRSAHVTSERPPRVQVPCSAR